MMFDTLIESRRRKDRRSGGTAVSVVLHAMLIVLAVVMTAEATDRPAHAPPTPEVIYRAVVKKPVEQPKPVTRTHAPVKLPPTEHIFREVALSPTIPTTLPPIDPTAPVVDPSDFDGVGVPDGAVSDARGAPDAGGVYYAFQVEKQTVAKDGNAKPMYPVLLESAHVEGSVLVQFVVDTTGRVDMSTVTVLEATNELFVDAVKRVMPSWRFYPAEAGGHKVRQLVQMRLAFTVP